MTRMLSRQPPEQTSVQKLRVFIEAKYGVPADEVFSKAEAAGVIVAPNKELSRVLVGSDEWRSIQATLPCWTGTMTGYVIPGKTFREGGEELRSIGKDYRYAIIYTEDKTGIRHILPIPREYEDEKDSILVTEHPNFWIVNDGKDRIVVSAYVDIVRGFPATNDWYLGDSYDIPCGNVTESSNQAARYLHRIAKRVGPVARFYDYVVGDRRDVDLLNWLSSGLGVAVIESGPKTRFDEPNGPHPYREAPRMIEDSGSGVLGTETESENDDVKPGTDKAGFLKRLSLAFGFD